MPSRPSLVPLAALLALAAACDAAQPRAQRADETSATISLAPETEMSAPAPPGGGAGGGVGGVGFGGGVARARVSVGAPVAPAARQSVTGEAAAYTSDDAMSSAADTTSVTPATSAASIASAMIIRTGSAAIEVDTIETAVARVRQLAGRVGGYVAGTTLQTGRNQQHTAMLELRIPAARYAEAVTGLTPLGRVENVSESTEDVGEEFVDVNARMANARRLEARLVDLLATRTGKLQDVLGVERELARVREEVERYEGRIRFLRTRAAVSTLQINLHEPLPVVARTGEGRSPVAAAFRQAWQNFVALLAFAIAAAGVVIPLAALAVAVWWIVRRGMQRTVKAVE